MLNTYSKIYIKTIDGAILYSAGTLFVIAESHYRFAVKAGGCKELLECNGLQLEANIFTEV